MKLLAKSQARIFSALLVTLALSGCGTTPKPNQPQDWGLWSYVPWTRSYEARVDEQVKRPRLAEGAKENVSAAFDVLQSMSNRAPAEEAALAFIKQAQREVGLPDKAIDVRPLLSTNASVRSKARQKVEKGFEGQNRDLASVGKTSEIAAKRGTAEIKQNSSAEVSRWKIMSFIKNFINSHWLALIIWTVLLMIIALTVVPIFFPYLGPVCAAIGHLIGQFFELALRCLGAVGRFWKSAIQNGAASQPTGTDSGHTPQTGAAPDAKPRS